MDLVTPMRGQDTRYMQEIVNWCRFDEMNDLDIGELDELKDELVALSALDFMEAGTYDADADLGAVDVMEVFSPPWFTEAAKRHGLRPGIAVDLSTCRPSDGVGWELLRKEDQAELDEIIEKDEPWLLTGSPRCDPFSQEQYLNRATTDEKVRERRLLEGREGLLVAIKAYTNQHDAGRYFLHEHPATATSWREQGMVDLMSREGVYYAQGPMCRYGLQLPEKYRDESDGVPEYVRKETGFVTNSEEVWHELKEEGLASWFKTLRRRLCKSRGESWGVRVQAEVPQALGHQFTQLQQGPKGNSPLLFDA